MADVFFSVARLDLQGAIESSRLLWELTEADFYVVDFGKLEWAEPFGMLYFARNLRTFADQRKPAKCRAVNHEKHGYAAHMGFFQSFGLSFGNVPGAGVGNDRYIPMTSLLIRDLHIEACGSAQDVREVIENRSLAMAKVLAHGESGSVQETLGFSLREVLRNVIEHSNADHIWYAAQYWPSKRTVELSILDQGQGIRSALSRNPHLVIDSDESAIRLALLPGVSGIAYKGKTPTRTDEWANSGYGLYMTSQLCARGGSFMLCSGDTALLRDADKETILRSGFSGTALRLEMFVPEIVGLGVALRDLNRKGEALAGQLGEKGIQTASKSSRGLSRPFE